MVQIKARDESRLRRTPRRRERRGSATQTCAICRRHYSRGGRHPHLSLVLSVPIRVADLALLLRFEKDHLRDSFPRVDLRGERSRIRDLQGDEPLPFRFERSDVGDDPTPRIGGFTHAKGEYAPGDAEVLDGTREGERVGWDDANVSLERNERALIELLRIDDRVIYIGKDFELVRHPHIVAVRGCAVGNGAAAHLSILERLDHAMLAGHAANPMIGLDTHAVLGRKGRRVSRREPKGTGRKSSGMELR